MDKIIKINAIQGGPFSSSNNLVDFDIPGEGCYDLSDSFVNLHVEVDAADVSAATGAGIYNVQLQWDGNDGTSIYNVALVKNCSMSCAKAGTIEDISRVDVLRQNLNEFTLSNNEKNSLQYRSIRQVYGQTAQEFSIFRELHGEGSIKSRNVTGQVQIPLKQLFNVGVLKEYPASKLGATRVHLELNIDKISAVQLKDFYDASAGSFEDVDNTSGANLDVTQIVTKNAYTDLKQSPFWVGQKLTFPATVLNDGSAITEAICVITEISRITSGANVNKLQLTLSNKIATVADTKKLTVVTCTQTACSAPALRFDRAELTLRRLANPPKPPSELTYTSFSTEQFTGDNSILNFQRMFQLESNAVNVLMMMPTGGDLVSHNDNLQSFRLRLDNEDLTNRSIVYNPIIHPLYYDRLSMTLLNGGMPLKSLVAANMDTKKSELSNQVTGRKVFLNGNPLPITPREKLLQINATFTTTGISSLFLYKQLLRSIKV